MSRKWGGNANGKLVAGPADVLQQGAPGAAMEFLHLCASVLCVFACELCV